jgi:hypothetical protein
MHPPEGLSEEEPMADRIERTPEHPDRRPATMGVIDWVQFGWRPRTTRTDASRSKRPKTLPPAGPKLIAYIRAVIENAAQEGPARPDRAAPRHEWVRWFRRDRKRQEADAHLGQLYRAGVLARTASAWAVVDRPGTRPRRQTGGRPKEAYGALRRELEAYEDVHPGVPYSAVWDHLHRLAEQARHRGDATIQEVVNADASCHPYPRDKGSWVDYRPHVHWVDAQGHDQHTSQASVYRLMRKIRRERRATPPT